MDVPRSGFAILLHVLLARAARGVKDAGRCATVNVDTVTSAPRRAHDAVTVIGPSKALALRVYWTSSALMVQAGKENMLYIRERLKPGCVRAGHAIVRTEAATLQLACNL